MFPDSKIAQAFQCARTKTTCVINPVIQLCQNGPFSILCDEDSNTEDKHLAILVRLWDDKLVSLLLAFLICQNVILGQLLNVSMHHLKKGLFHG